MAVKTGEVLVGGDNQHRGRWEVEARRRVWAGRRGPYQGSHTLSRERLEASAAEVRCKRSDIFEDLWDRPGQLFLIYKHPLILVLSTRLPIYTL